MYVYQKSANHIIAKFALEFPCKRCSKTRKNNYISRLQENLESYLASTAFLVSGITNTRRLIRECLESHISSNYRQGLGIQPCPNQRHSSGSHPTASSSFTNASDIPIVTVLLIKTSVIGYLLKCRYCC